MENLIKTHKRMLMISIGVFVAICTMASIRTGQVEVTQQQATEMLRSYLNRVGLLATGAKISTRRMGNAVGDLWQSGVIQATQSFFVLQRPNGLVALIEDGDLSVAISENRSATTHQAFASDLDARSEAGRWADKFREGRPVVRTKWSFVQNGQGNPPRRTAAMAVYAGLIDGYPVTDFVHSCEIKLDAQTGKLVSLRQHWIDLPHDLAEPRLDELGAKDAAAQATHSDRGSWDRAKATLGWARPTGGDRLRLSWKLELETTGPVGAASHNYWVDAKNGTLLKQVP